MGEYFGGTLNPILGFSGFVVLLVTVADVHVWVKAKIGSHATAQKVKEPKPMRARAAASVKRARAA